MIAVPRIVLLSPVFLCLVVGVSLLGPTESRAQAEEIEEIVITGTRLRRTDLESPSPIVALSEDDIRSFGPVTIDDVMNEMPQLAPTDGRQAGLENRDGALKADLRGLGPVRTLILVNGRRYTPANADGVVDLGTIPTSMVQRVDVLTGGASAVYGSDAVAGAINFVLRDDFEGVEFRGTYGETFESDGQNANLELLAGSNFADGRGNVMAAVAYLEGDSVLQGDRQFSEVPVLNNGDGTLTQVGSSGIPGGFIPGSYAGLPPANCPSGSRPSGVIFRDGGIPVSRCSPADNYNYAPPIYLLRPYEQYQLSGVFTYDFSDNVEIFGESYFVNVSQDTQAAPDAKVLRSLLIPSYATNTVISSATRDFLIANAATFDPENTGNARLPQLRKRFTDIGNRQTVIDRDGFSVTAGLRGDGLLAADGPGWGWEAFLTRQESASNILNVGTTLLSRLGASHDYVFANGGAQCRNSALFPGCTPIALFGENTLNADQARFLAPSFTDSADFARTIAGASITGELFDLPGGQVGVAAGLEYREDEYDSKPSPERASGDIGRSSGPPVSGKLDVTEYFLEVGVPIIENMLDVEAAVRVADYSASGIGTATTYKGGIVFAPTDWIRFRGAVNRAIRAPNLNELFSPISTGNFTVADPCDSGNMPSQAVKEFCVSQGVPGTEIDRFVQLEQFALISRGGNPGLEEETADTITAGVVVTPIENLNIQVDYYDITVEDAIDSVDQQITVNNCFDALELNNRFCRLIERDNIGQLAGVSANLNNVAERVVSGLDITVDYAFDTDGFGFGGAASEFRFSLLASRQFENEITPFEGAETIDCAGKFLGPCSGFANPSTPALRLFGSANWRSGPLSANLRIRWIDSLDRYETSSFPLAEVDAITYVDLNIGYQFNDSINVNLGMLNVLDEQPQPVSAFDVNDSNVDPAVYDQIGARYFLSIVVQL